jgi:peptidoglycan/xylan/chitin deacetylase (PgdA/CDA1 family)
MSPPLLTIVAYHYVRHLARSRYPGIKGLNLADFKEQLAYLRKYYYLASVAEGLAALANETDLPPNAAWLTFDDGYLDHFTNVFPLLAEYQIEGLFFPVAQAVKEGRVLDVNKIHFVLAASPGTGPILQALEELLAEVREDYQLASWDCYWERYAKAPWLDPPEVEFIKKMLQKALPQPLRAQVVDRLFQKFVTTDEAAFAAELYMNLDQLRLIQAGGMYIGGHGYDHVWMDTLPPERQQEEAARTREFLGEVGAPQERWVFSYPYGAVNDTLMAALQEHGCCAAVTVDMGVADLRRNRPMLLPRLDTNDLPKDAGAAPNRWTKMAIQTNAR